MPLAIPKAATLGGLNFGEKVVPGSAVETGRFPYQVALFDEDFDFYVHGGSLIAPNVVLTAAHFPPGLHTNVVLGCDNFRNLSNCEVIEIERNIIFEDFDSDEHLSGDLQLLILTEDSVQIPVALAAPGFDLDPGQNLTLIGWTEIDPLTQFLTIGTLRESVVQTINQEECDYIFRDFFGDDDYEPDPTDYYDPDEYYNQTDYFDPDEYYYFPDEYYYTPDPGRAKEKMAPLNETIINDFKFCASGDGKDSCLRDSGTPILLRCDGTGDDLQLGVTSFGRACDPGGLPGVFAKVFHPDGFKFINDTVTSLGHSLKTIDHSSSFCVNDAATLTPTISNEEAEGLNDDANDEKKAFLDIFGVLVLAFVAVVLLFVSYVHLKTRNIEKPENKEIPGKV